MTVTENQVEAVAAEPARDESVTTGPRKPSGLAGVLGTADHKTIGRLWIGVAIIELLVLAAVWIANAAERVDTGELDVSDGLAGLFTDAEANRLVEQLFSLHRVGFALLFLAPLLVGLATYLVPLQVGARTIAFPRAAAAAFWTWLVADGVVAAAYIANGGPGGGRSDALDLWLVGLAGVLIALLLATVCVLTTIIALRTPHMRLHQVPMFSWAFLVVGTMWLLTWPILVGNILLVYVAHHYDAAARFAISSLVMPQVGWVLGQPTVYLFAAIAFGFAADVIPVATQRRQQGRWMLQGAIAAVALLGFGAYTQPVFAPTFVTSSALFVGVGVVVVLPVLVIVGGLADTLVRGGPPRMSAALLHAVFALLIGLVTVVAGALYAIEPLELVDTSAADAVTNGAMLTGAIGAVGALHWWCSKIWGRGLNEMLGVLTALALAGGASLIVIPDLISGFLDQPAGFVVMDQDSGVEGLNAVVVAGAALVAVGAVLLALNVLVNLVARRGSSADDPWSGHTLEWASESPPSEDNFDAELAEVVSASPLLDAREYAASSGDESGEG